MPPWHATGWRVPSVVTTESGLPAAWIDSAPAAPTAVVTEPSSSPTTSSTGAEGREIAEFGQADAMIRRGRGWTFWTWSFRRRHHEVESADVDAPADLDLVALGAEDQAWTDLTLAALEEPDTADAWVPEPEVAGSSTEAHDGPWSVLAEELRGLDHESTETASDGSHTTPLELEQEFWT